MSPFVIVKTYRSISWIGVKGQLDKTIFTGRMKVMYELLERLAVFQVVIEVIQVIFGAGLCFGALKWRRGSLTTTAAIWGLLLGFSLGFSIVYSGDGDIGILLMTCGLGAVVFPILTYIVAGVNRFVLGFLFGTKFIALITTVMFKEGAMDFEVALILPFVCGAFVGLIMMAWVQMRVLPFVLCCTFIGASDIAPTVSEWVSRIGYTATGDISYLFDPVDLLFALFKIELTDTVTLITMTALLIIGSITQINNLKAQGIPSSTPIIGFEVPRSENGKIEIR